MERLQLVFHVDGIRIVLGNRYHGRRNGPDRHIRSGLFVVTIGQRPDAFRNHAGLFLVCFWDHVFWGKLEIRVIQQFEDPIQDDVGMVGQDVNDDGQDDGIK